ncbi:hypothetical protein NVP2275O_168 [Vibrio phage 2.275.O._10N.286.54.E11]|nr:hypothetical protein NVP2275O_168 [Vibrio phage 2.275.O._10N.286.54.E11]
MSISRGFYSRLEDEDGISEYLSRMTRNYEGLQTNHQQVIFNIVQCILSGNQKHLDYKSRMASKASHKWFNTSHAPRHSTFYSQRRAKRLALRLIKPNQRRRGIG